MSWRSSAAASSASTAGAHVRPLPSALQASLARRGAAACVPSCGASRLGAAARRADSSVRTLVVAASRKPSGSQPTRQANPPTAPEAASPPPGQLLVSVAKPLVLPLGAFLGGQLAELPADSSMRLAGLALAAQALAAATGWANGALFTRVQVIFTRKYRHRGRTSLGTATAEWRTKAQDETLFVFVISLNIAAALSACWLLEAAGNEFGFSFAATVEHYARSKGTWDAHGGWSQFQQIIFLVLAIRVFIAWQARSMFYAAIAERRRQNAAHR